MNEPTEDQANEHRLVSRIDGEEVRLLVHIEPIDPAGDDATGSAEDGEAGTDDGSGMGE